MLPEDFKKLNISLTRFRSVFEVVFTTFASSIYRHATSYGWGRFCELLPKTYGGMLIEKRVPSDGFRDIYRMPGVTNNPFVQDIFLLASKTHR